MRTRADTITALSLEDGAHAVDEAGYLTDPDDWSEAFARHVAAQEGVTLTDTHWRVIDFMRAYLDDHGIAADARFVMRFLAETEGLDKAGARARLFALFPYGYVRQACKMAGMRQPRAWSTG